MLTAPQCANNACGVVSRAADLDVRWTAPTLGTVEIQLIESPVIIRCQIPASAGMMTIPSAALQLLMNGTGMLMVGGVARTTVRAGGITDVTFAVSNTTIGLVTLTP